MGSQPPLDLQWVFGVSSDVRGGVLDLRTDGSSQRFAYAAGHIIVIYDRSQHQQMFLQGHVHQIQCLSACPKKKFIASADYGPNASLIVWTSANGQDVKDPSKSVGTILKRQQAMAKTAEVQKSICEFTLSSFVPSSDSAITGMISGEVVFWQEHRSPFFKESSKTFSCVISKENCEEEPSASRIHAVKVVRLHHSPITHLSVFDNYVVTGGSDGYVRFYDPSLGLVGWFEELQAGA